MKVGDLHAATNPTNVSKIPPSVDKTTENKDNLTVKVDTNNTDSVTLSDEAIALAKEKEGEVSTESGGDGNGEKPPKTDN